MLCAHGVFGDALEFALIIAYAVYNLEASYSWNPEKVFFVWFNLCRKVKKMEIISEIRLN